MDTGGWVPYGLILYGLSHLFGYLEERVPAWRWIGE